jgi:T-complex protein 1 subunit beta
LAIEAFAKALRAIPAILADNAGFDSSDLVTKLRAAHHNGQSNSGLDMNKGILGDMVTLKITESFKCKSQVLISSHEAAEMIVRVDEIIRTAPRFDLLVIICPLLLCFSLCFCLLGFLFWYRLSQ